MFSSHSSCLTVNVSGPAVKLGFGIACIMFRHPFLARQGIQPSILIVGSCLGAKTSLTIVRAATSAVHYCHFSPMPDRPYPCAVSREATAMSVAIRQIG